MVSSDPGLRAQMSIAARSIERTTGRAVEAIEASDGLAGIGLAWKYRPDLIVADEITSHAGAFALTKELKGAEKPFGGKIVILLDRAQDSWLARWSGADAWFVKPVNPFELAETVTRLERAAEEEAV